MCKRAGIELDDFEALFGENSGGINEMMPSTKKRDKSESDIRMKDIENKLSSISSNICPTCHQVLQDQSSVDEMRHNLTEEYSTIFNKIIELDNTISKEESNKESLNLQLTNLLQNPVDSKDISAISEELSKYTTRNDQLINNSKSQIQNSEATISDLNNSIDNRRSNISNLNSDININKFLKSVTSRDFRSYLLEEVVKYLNMKLAEYSMYLFDTSVRLEVSGNNINLYLGDRVYEMLSGGERRRIDFIFVSEHYVR